MNASHDSRGSVLLGLFLATALCVALALTACYERRWDAPDLRAPEHSIAVALGDGDRGAGDIDAASVPEVPPPGALRPCCAFGTKLGVKMQGVKVPLFELANVTEAEALGPHRYDNGALSVDIRDRRGWVDDEKNGLVYTCRGGFIDTAHVRDNADLTLALAAALARRMDAGGASIELADQGAKIRVRGRPVDPALVGEHGRRELAVAGAQWLAFQVSIWHEIATWYGYASMSAWPEKVSSFTPDDLYANLVGVKIAGGIIRENLAYSDDEYHRSMDAWLARVLERLDAVPVETGIEAMSSVDGIWWDSSRRLPEWELVTRRHMQVGPEIAPWLVSMATPAPPEERRFAGCPADVEPLTLRNPQGFEGIPFTDYLTLEFEVGDAMAAAGFPFPRAGSRRVTQADFPFLVERIRAEMTETLGPDVDRP